jgi:flagellin
MLDLNTNVSSLIAENSLNNTSSLLSKSLQRLSTGLKVNSGADGPAAFVISQEQQSQITGLQAAIQNTSEATSLVQTAGGALSTINDLLNQMRSLALDSANSGVNDPNAQAANQAEVANALATIDRIATNTQFGTKQILNGSAGLSGVTTNPNTSFINAQANVASAGSYAVQITTAAQKALAVASAPNTGPLSQNETVTINGVNIGLTKGQTLSQQVDAINAYTGQTGVVASTVQTSASATLGTGVTGTTLLSSLAASTAAYAANDTLTISGTDGDGTAINGTVTLAAGATATVQDVLDQLNGTNVGGNNATLTKILQHSTASVNGNGDIVLTSNSVLGDTTATSTALSLTIADGAGDTGATTWAPLFAAPTQGSSLALQSTLYGSAQTIIATSNVAASGTSSGIGTGAGITGTGVDIVGTIGGFGATGHGDILTGNTGTKAQGITISAGNNVTGALGQVNVTDNSLVFQIGANANQTVKVGIDNVGTAALGLNVANDQFANLGQINIETESGAQDAIKIIDAATLQVSTLSGTLGAIQSQTLAETASNLQTTLTNTTSAEGVIRDTDYAAETANYSQYQVQMQVGTSVLSNSNQLAALVTHLFQ